MTISGRVVRVVGGDTLAAPRTIVILHRVSSKKQGPVDSVASASDGSFSFRVKPDSGDIFLVSARRGGVEYFGQPFTAAVLTTDRHTELVVADTSATASVTTSIRQLVIVAPSADGAREVVDVVTVVNHSGMTRVASGTPRTTWRLALPARAVDPHLDDSDFAPDAIQQIGDTLVILAPIPPGEHVLYLSYHIPPGTRRFVIPILDAVDSVSLMAGEGKLKVDGAFKMVETKELEGKTFSHWEGRIPAHDSLVVNLPGDGRAPAWLLPALVALLGLGLVGAGTMALRRRHVAPVPVATAPRLNASTEALLDQIVQLDAEHAAGPDGIGPAAWQAYLTKRQQLKDELKRSLPS